MLIVGSRLLVSDNSGAKEVQCIKTKGRFATIGDIITCSVKKATRGKVEQVSGCQKMADGSPVAEEQASTYHSCSVSTIFSRACAAGPGRQGCDCGDQEGGAAAGRQRHQV